MIVRFVIATLAASMVLFGCSKDSGPTDPGTDSPFTGTSFLRAKLGTIDFKPTGLTSLNEVPPDVTVEPLGDNQFAVSISGASIGIGSVTTLNVNATISTTNGATYPIGSLSAEGGAAIGSSVTDMSGTSTYASQTDAGTLVIDRIDTGAKRIAGHFNATLTSFGDETKTLSVTNGTFEIGY